MAYTTIEDRVDRLEALFGQFMTELALQNKRAEERLKAAESRHEAAEARQKAAEERQQVIEKAAEARHEAAEARQRAAAERQQAIEKVADERHRAAEERMARFGADMRASRKELDKKWGDLANKMGTIIEDILVPNLRRLAIEHFRFPVIDDFMIRRARRHGRVETEFDTLVIGPEAVILGEAKSTPSIEYAEAFAAKAQRFFDYFPEYRGRRLICVFGSWAIPDPVIERLTVLGIYALRMGEETMELANAATLESSEPPKG
ncbi:MAG: hypothetical protein ACYDC1_23525 [Limisphaerales bacterium]